MPADRQDAGANHVVAVLKTAAGLLPFVVEGESVRRKQGECQACPKGEGDPSTGLQSESGSGNDRSPASRTTGLGRSRQKSS
jgi:hypothetical protein